jgi:hypothetical protein
MKWNFFFLILKYQGGIHLHVVCALDVPLGCYTTPTTSFISLGVPYHFLFDAHSTQYNLS